MITFNSRLRDSTSEVSVEVVILVLISFSLVLKEVRVSLLEVMLLSMDEIISLSWEINSLSTVVWVVPTCVILVDSSLNLVAVSCFSIT